MIIEMLQMGMPLTKVNDNSMEAIAIAVVIHCRLFQQAELVYRKLIFSERLLLMPIAFHMIAID